MRDRRLPLRILWLMGLAGLGCGAATSSTESLPLAPTVVAASDKPAVTLESTRPGEDWSSFLGPLQTGVSRETGLLTSWPEQGPPVLWKVPLGEGYAPPSVMGERTVVMHRLRDREYVECLHTQTGESLWKYDYPTDFQDPYGYNGGSRCAPVLTADRCYTFGPQGKLLALDLATGKKVWDNDTTQNWKIPPHFFGAGCTPVLDGNLLIVLVGGQPESGVVAFEADTGKVVWQSVGRTTWDGVPMEEQGGRPYSWTGDEMLVSYSTPTVATIHGQKHLLCLMRQGLVSLDPRDGRVRFKYWFRSKTHESVNAARPVVIDDQVFLSAAYETGAALLKVYQDSAGYDVVWRKRRGLSTHWSTTLAHQGYLYGFSGRHEQEAQLQCVDLTTGDLVWQTMGYEKDIADLEQDPQTGRIREKSTGRAVPFPYFGRGSLILADGKFIIMAERGTLALAEPSVEGYREISRTSFPELKYPCWAAPVLSRGRLLLRSESHLVCLDLLPSSKTAP